MQLGRRPVFFGLGLATLVGGFGRSAYSRRWRDRPQQTPHPLGGTAPTGDTSENAGSGTANDTASPATIEGYCSATSVVQGGVLQFHVRAAWPTSFYTVDIYRVGATDSLVASEPTLGTTFIPSQPEDDVTLAQNGCNWPVGYTLPIGPSWPSGLYYARLTGYGDRGGTAPTGAGTVLGFVVTPVAPGSGARILLCITDTTYQAYNDWGGRSLYSTPQAVRVSYDRPYDGSGTLPIGDGEVPFIRWAERKGIAIHYCSDSDLHNGSILKNYSLLLSVGHDEYWTKQMFDNVQSYVANGGNVCFFSGNDLFWQARLENNDRSLVCYKYAATDPIQDPALGGPTILWYATGRPGNTLVGAGPEYGAGWWSNVQPTPARLRGYVVQNTDHWVFAGTGLKAGDIIGQGDTIGHAILGYETDAAQYTLVNGIAQPTGADGSPTNFTILGFADLTDWPDNGADGRAGYATMGIHQINGGTVFTAGTVNWAAALRTDVADRTIRIITSNLVSRLGSGLPA
jgi:hypothetical protein